MLRMREILRRLHPLTGALAPAPAHKRRARATTRRSNKSRSQMQRIACAWASSLFACCGATSPKTAQRSANIAAQLGSNRQAPSLQLAGWPSGPVQASGQASALAGLEAPLRLVDHVDAAFAAHDAVVAVPAAQRFQRVTDFHGLFLAARLIRTGGVIVNVGSAAVPARSGSKRP